MTRPILIAAGGTGGHLFPAEAVTAELVARGHSVLFVTDRRGEAFKTPLAGVTVARIDAATIGGVNPFALIGAVFRILSGTAGAFRLIGRMRPAAAIGFGGYPALPAMLAAALRGVPAAVHDGNAVLGRANRLVARFMTAIAAAFPVLRHAERYRARVVVTGNPVRPGIAARAGAPYTPPSADAPVRLAVFGGSQGARIMSDVVPEALAGLPEALRRRLAVVQQCRAEDLERTRAAYAASGVAAELAAFFSDVPDRLVAAHLVIARSGASTCAELTAIGRAAILVPYPHATDDHQFWNAGVLEEAGAAVRIRQDGFTPERLAAMLTTLLGDPRRLAAMAAASAGLGRSDAAQRLADLAERLAGAGPAVAEVRP